MSFPVFKPSDRIKIEKLAIGGFLVWAVEEGRGFEPVPVLASSDLDGVVAFLRSNFGAEIAKPLNVHQIYDAIQTDKAEEAKADVELRAAFASAIGAGDCLSIFIGGVVRDGMATSPELRDQMQDACRRWHAAVAELSTFFPITVPRAGPPKPKRD